MSPIPALVTGCARIEASAGHPLSPFGAHQERRRAGPSTHPPTEDAQASVAVCGDASENGK